jgi:hypothetical protein
MELDLVFNWSGSKFFEKMIGTKGFGNPKNWSYEFSSLVLRQSEPKIQTRIHKNICKISMGNKEQNK